MPWAWTWQVQPRSDGSGLVSLSDCPVHHFNLGRRIPGFDYGPDGFGTGLTPLHLSDDGEGGTFHFHDPPPPYTAYKYPDIDQPDDPPPPYEASINPDSMFYDPAGDPQGKGAMGHNQLACGPRPCGPPTSARPSAFALVFPLRWSHRLGWAHSSQGRRWPLAVVSLPLPPSRELLLVSTPRGPLSRALWGVGCPDAGLSGMVHMW